VARSLAATRESTKGTRENLVEPLSFDSLGLFPFQISRAISGEDQLRCLTTAVAEPAKEPFGCEILAAIREKCLTISWLQAQFDSHEEWHTSREKRD